MKLFYYDNYLFILQIIIITMQQINQINEINKHIDELSLKLTQLSDDVNKIKSQQIVQQNNHNHALDVVRVNNVSVNHMFDIDDDDIDEDDDFYCDPKYIKYKTTACALKRGSYVVIKNRLCKIIAISTCE